jgi:pyruvate,water dikinase
MRAVGIREPVIAEHRPLLRNLLGLIHGRVYYNLNNWYRGLLLLPAFRRNKEDMERMMGVEDPIDFVTDESLGAVARLQRIPRLAATAARLALRFATLQGDTARFLARFDATIAGIDRSSLPKRSFGELMGVVDTLRRECLDRWTTPIVNDFFVMMSVGRLRRLVDRAVHDDVDRVMQTLLGGADVAVSAAPAMLMLEMADAARERPGVIDALRDCEGHEALERASAASPRFARAYAELVVRYGDRCMGELKLESRPLRDDPGFVVGILRNYLAGGTADPRLLADRARRDREGVERDVAASMGSLQRWRFRRALRSARRAIRARETMRLARTRLFGTYRDTYRAIAAQLRAQGKLDAIDDIFYLTTGEIDAYWRRTTVTTDLRALVRARRREFAAFEAIDAPNRIVTTGDVVNAVSQNPTAPKPPNPATTLRGVAASAGIAEGRVRIVTGPSGDLSLAGHVLVATRTDPGWAPLFPSAVAIVVERGSVLSHSAVLARELGLPAVVSVPDVVRTLRDGELVRVDGAAGTIERLELPCAS